MCSESNQISLFLNMAAIFDEGLKDGGETERQPESSLSGRKRGRALVQRAVRRPGFCLRCSGTQQTDTFLSVELKHNFTTCFFETLT